jgi:hypothetical protein
VTLAVKVVRFGPGSGTLTPSTQHLAMEGIFGPIAAGVPTVHPGDFLLTHSAAWTGKLIRFGQRIRFTGEDAKYAHWNHAALFVNYSGDIIEALGAGVQLRNVSVYRDTEYHVVYLQNVSDEDRAQEVAFAQHCLHDRYGWLTDASLGLSLLTGSKFGFGINGQMICSGLVARCLERTGEIFEFDSWNATPAELAKHFKVANGLPAAMTVMARGMIPPAKAQVKEKSR